MGSFNSINNRKIDLWDYILKMEQRFDKRLDELSSRVDMIIGMLIKPVDKEEQALKNLTKRRDEILV